MRIINLITIKDNVVYDIDSYFVSDDEAFDDVVVFVEDEFIRKAKKLGWNAVYHYCDNESDLIEEGFYKTTLRNEGVCISWSHIEGLT